MTMIATTNKFDVLDYEFKATKKTKEPKNKTMKTKEEPKNETMKTKEEPKNETMKTNIVPKRDNLKTTMCKSVAEKKECPYGTHCNFAHNLDELRLTSCMFGERCHFVSWNYNTEKYENSGVKQCVFLHPEESKMNYGMRLGLQCGVCEEEPKEETKVEPPISLPLAPIPPNAWELHAISQTSLETESKPVRETESKPVRETESKPVRETEMTCQEETVLRVPAELALQAMEIALNAGKSNIRIEIC
jgi:hypothetical protein